MHGRLRENYENALDSQKVPKSLVTTLGTVILKSDDDNSIFHISGVDNFQEKNWGHFSYLYPLLKCVFVYQIFYPKHTRKSAMYISQT